MGRLGGYRSRDVRRVAESLGWQFDRWSGDHMVFFKPGSTRNLSIPDHRSIAPGTLRQLIRTMEITVGEFLTLVRKYP